MANFIWVGVLYKSHEISHDTPPNTLLSNVQQLFHPQQKILMFLNAHKTHQNHDFFEPEDDY